MKIKSSQIQKRPIEKKLTKVEKKALQQEKVKARLKAKFGKNFEKKVPKDEVDVKIRGVKSSNENDFGDIGTNDPKSAETQEKLKEILKTGAFKFNPRERKALASILK